MTRTGVLTAVESRKAGRTVACAMLLTLLMGSGVSAAVLLNPSFEDTKYSGRTLPRYWYTVDDPSCFGSYSFSSWRTDGLWSVGLFSLMKKSVSSGRYQGLVQEDYVDLTGIGTIKFDVRLARLPWDGPFEHFEASFLVDRVPLWRQTVAGEYRDQEVSVAGMAGRHRIEMRITALDDDWFGYNYAYWTQWDNLRLIEGQPTIPALVDLDPSTLNPASNGKWITCYIELGQDALGQPYDVHAIDGATVTLNSNDHGVPAYLGDEGWATAAANAENVADFDGDGVLERMVKFDRAAVQALVQPPEPATVSIQGRLAGGIPTNGIMAGKPINGLLLEGTATIRVLDDKPKKP